MITRNQFAIGQVALIVAIALGGCQPAGSNPQAGPPPAPVTVETIKPRNLSVEFEYTGQTAGSREVEIRARVNGILEKRNFEEGAAVTAGQSLFTIDQAPFEAALARAEADLGSSEANLALAEHDVKRLKPLFEAKAVSRKQYDDAVAAEKVAAANVKVAQARLTQARLDLSYTRVQSPINGITSRALRSEGNYVTGPEVLLTKVTQIDPMYVLFGIPDEDRLKLEREVAAGRVVPPEKGAYKISVKLADGSVYPHAGVLTFSDVRVSEMTGTAEARAELPNPKGDLRPGQFVRVLMTGASRPDAILVPQRSVLEGPQGKFVYVVSDEGKAAPRPVTAGDWYEKDWIITAGLKPGDKVIVDGVMKIGPGAPVRVTEPAPPGQAGSPPSGGADKKAAAKK